MTAEPAKKFPMKWMLIILVSIASAIGIGYAVWKNKSTPAAIYRNIKVEKGDLSTTIQTTGTVQPENRLEIKPPIAGRVEQVLVKEGQRVTKGQILAWMSSTERAALLDAARSQGSEEVKRWEELYRSTPVVAPITGTIILRSVESGQTFTNTDAILVMSDRLTVKAQFDETDIAQVRLKQQAEIVLDAYSGQRFPAIVDQIAYEAKTVNNVTTYLVDVLPEKTPEFMRSGMTANVTVFVESRKNILLVPTEAVIGTGSTVLVRGADGKVIEKNFEPGLSDGKNTEVKSGLSESDIVLIEEVVARTGTTGATNPFAPSRPPRAGGNRGGKK